MWWKDKTLYANEWINHADLKTFVWVIPLQKIDIRKLKNRFVCSTSRFWQVHNSKINGWIHFLFCMMIYQTVTYKWVQESCKSDNICRSYRWLAAAFQLPRLFGCPNHFFFLFWPLQLIHFQKDVNCPQDLELFGKWISLKGSWWNSL